MTLRVSGGSPMGGGDGIDGAGAGAGRDAGRSVGGGDAVPRASIGGASELRTENELVPDCPWAASNNSFSRDRMPMSNGALLMHTVPRSFKKCSIKVRYLLNPPLIPTG